MKNIFRSLVLASVAMASVALTTTSAMAESTVDVPFNFTVAGKSLPAGQYMVRHDKTLNRVTLSSKDATHSYSWIIRPGDPPPDATRVVVKFDVKGQNHTLRSIQYGALETPRLDKTAGQSEAAESIVGQ